MAAFEVFETSLNAWQAFVLPLHQKAKLWWRRWESNSLYTCLWDRSRCLPCLPLLSFMSERVEGFEPPPKDWKSLVLPLNTILAVYYSYFARIVSSSSCPIGSYPGIMSHTLLSFKWVCNRSLTWSYLTLHVLLYSKVNKMSSYFSTFFHWQSRQDSNLWKFY